MDLDPNLKATYEGPDAGVGQKLIWSSTDKNVGSGTQEITKSEVPNLVVSHIVFGGQGAADASIKLSPDGAGTRVIWTFDMQPPGGVIGRYMWMMMKGPVGKDYDKGLSRLKAFAEKLPKVTLGDFTAGHVNVAAQQVVRVRTSSEETTADVARTLDKAYGLLGQAAAAKGLTRAGAPMSVVAGVDKDRVLIDAELPVSGTLAGDLPAGIAVAKTYEGGALKAVYRGPREGLVAVYPKLAAYAAVNGWTAVGGSWNVYVSDPAATSADALETDIYLPSSNREPSGSNVAA